LALGTSGAAAFPAFPAGGVLPAALETIWRRGQRRVSAAGNNCTFAEPAVRWVGTHSNRCGELALAPKQRAARVALETRMGSAASCIDEAAKQWSQLDEAQCFGQSKRTRLHNEFCVCCRELCDAYRRENTCCTFHSKLNSEGCRWNQMRHAKGWEIRHTQIKTPVPMACPQRIQCMQGVRLNLERTLPHRSLPEYREGVSPRWETQLGLP